jgi:hypothetical protein
MKTNSVIREHIRTSYSKEFSGDLFQPVYDPGVIAALDDLETAQDALSRIRDLTQSVGAMKYPAETLNLIWSVCRCSVGEKE